MTILFAPHPQISMRPTNDKEPDQSGDHLFEQFIETGLLQLCDNAAERSSSQDLARFFELPCSTDIDPFETSPKPDWVASSGEPWHKAPQQLDQNRASPTLRVNSSSIYPDSFGRASASEPQLFKLENLYNYRLKSPSRVISSTPATPTPSASRSRSKPATPRRRPLSGTHSISAGVRKPSGKASPTMMRPSHYAPAPQHLWTRKFDTVVDSFNLQLPPHIIPVTPPTPTKPIKHEDTGFTDQPYSLAVGPRNGTLEGHHDLSHHATYQLTPLTSPTLDQNSTDVSFSSSDNMAYLSQHLGHGALSALHTPPSSDRLPMNSWATENTTNLDLSFSASPDFDAQAPQTKQSHWWAASSSSQPSSTNYQTSQPRSESIGSSISYSTASSVAGLGISCGGGLGSFTDLSMGSYPATTMAGDFYGGYSSLVAHQNITPPSRSPSTSPPPHTCQPAHRERRISSKGRAASHHHSAHYSTQRRKSSSQSSSSGPRPASVGFVNFTPDDSRKILTGVAPSGSSKTKARREKEAAEKRRRLSQAAAKAIMDAGGDITELQREGLLVVE